jgi:hypothetical protein
MLDIITQISTRAFMIFLEAFPYLLLGVLVSAVIEEFVPESAIKRIAPKNAVLSAGFGVVMGLIFPVCECGTIPVARRLSAKGMSHGTVFSFLFAAPIINPVVILSTSNAFGVSSEIFFWRVALGISIPFVLGLLASLIPPKESIIKDNAVSSCSCGHNHNHDCTKDQDEDIAKSKGFFTRLKRIGSHIISEFVEVGSILVIGCLITSTTYVIFPKEAWLSLANAPWIAIFLMAFMAIILSICSTVDALVIKPLYGLFPPASILTFLVLGPMFDIKTLLLVNSAFKKKYAYPVYLIAILLCLAVSFALEAFLL